MKIKTILNEIEQFAPSYYQENYDNCGIQVGNAQIECNGVLITLDITENVLNEAIAMGCNLIVAHHPLIFSGLKKITGKNYVERVIMKAIKHDIVLYAAHTNIDNVKNGVNAKIAEKIGLINTKILAPSRSHKLCKFNTYVPIGLADQVKEAIFSVGGGKIGNYSECAFEMTGVGTFKPSDSANPKIGEPGGIREQVKEVKIEALIPEYLSNSVLQAVRNVGFYEEVAYELIPLQNTDQNIGAGMIGELKQPMELMVFLSHLKQAMKTDVIKFTPINGISEIKTVALCGGSGSFLYPTAQQQSADIFITADYKYHQFFEAENDTIIADIGHYESEQYTVEIFYDILIGKFPNFAVILSSTNTNPINYFI